MIVVVIAMVVIAVITIAMMPVPAIVASVVVVAAPMRVTTPMRAMHLPAVAHVHPAWLVIHVAWARGMPHAAHPYVAAAGPVPVTRRPYVTRTRRRYYFVARRRRWYADLDADTHLRGCGWRESRGGAPCNGERGKQCEFACVHDAPPSCRPDVGLCSRVTHESANRGTFIARSFRSRRVSGSDSRFAA